MIKNLRMPLAVSVLVACNAVAGLDDDFKLGASSGPSVGGEDANVPDVNNGRVDASSVEEDAAALPETGARDADAALPVSFDCNGTLFCWDFESSAGPSNWGWSGNFSSATAPSVDATAGFRGKGLHVKAGSGTSSALYQDKGIPAWTTQTLSLQFRFRILSAPADYAVIGAFEFNGHEHGLAVYGSSGKCFNGASPCVDDNDPADRGHSSAGSFKYTANTWYRGQVTLKRSGQDYAGTVKVDDALLDNRVTGAMPAQANPPSSVRILSGAFYSGAGQGAEVDIDEVLVRFQ